MGEGGRGFLAIFLVAAVVAMFSSTASRGLKAYKPPAKWVLSKSGAR